MSNKHDKIIYSIKKEFFKQNYLRITQIIKENINILDKSDYPSKTINIKKFLYNYSNENDERAVVFSVMINIVRYLIRKNARLFPDGVDDNKNNNNNNNNKNNKTSVCFVKSKSIIELFLLYCKLFAFQKNKVYIGMDFEFDKRELGLMQVCFFDRAYKFVFLIHPNIDFSKSENKELIFDFYLNPKLYFILHGSDSLDTPYIYSLFSENSIAINYFITFLSKTYDTRFLCEFSKFKNNYPNYKCSLYIALLYAHAITETEYNSLLRIEHALHPIYKINWLQIKAPIINYAIHDVLHLDKLLNNLVDENTELITDIYRFTILNKLIKNNAVQINNPGSADTLHFNNNKLYLIISKIDTFKPTLRLINKLLTNDKNKLIQLLETYKLNNLKHFLNNSE